MKRDRIIDLGRTFRFQEKFPEFVTLFSTDYILIVDVWEVKLRVMQFRRSQDLWGKTGLFKELVVIKCIFSSLSVLGIQVRMFDPDHRGLNRIQSEISSDHTVVVFLFSAMHPFQS